MAEYTPGITQQPVLETIDGNGFLVIRCNPVIVEGIPNMELIISPFDWTKAKLKLTGSDLDFSEDPYGTIKRTYPSANIFPVSINPEKPVWWLLCGFNGEEINTDNPTMYPILELKNKLETSQHEVARLRGEVESLRKDNRKLVTLTKSYRDKMSELFGEKGVTVVPEKYLSETIGKDGFRRG